MALFCLLVFHFIVLFYTGLLNFIISYLIIMHLFFDDSLVSSEGESTRKDVDLGGWEMGAGAGRS